MCDEIKCPYCGGKLKTDSDVKIGTYVIICEKCDTRWIDESETEDT